MNMANVFLVSFILLLLQFKFPYCRSGRSELNSHIPPLNRFAKNVSLNKFAIEGSPHVIAQFLPFFLEPAHFAPQLEVLGVSISSFRSYDIPLLEGLAPLDEFLCSCPSLTRAIFFPGNFRFERLNDIRNLIKKSLPGCGEKGIIEFRPPKE